MMIAGPTCRLMCKVHVVSEYVQQDENIMYEKLEWWWWRLNRVCNLFQVLKFGYRHAKNNSGSLW